MDNTGGLRDKQTHWSFTGFDIAGILCNNCRIMVKQLISKEKFTSVRDAQSGLAKLFAKASRENGFYRVLRNNKSLGVLIPDSVWESFLEDLEALSSPAYLRRIEFSRKDKERYSSDDVKKMLGI